MPSQTGLARSGVAEAQKLVVNLRYILTGNYKKGVRQVSESWVGREKPKFKIYHTIHCGVQITAATVFVKMLKSQ